jgi:polyisoprenoid-binding protein YceI
MFSKRAAVVVIFVTLAAGMARRADATDIYKVAGGDVAVVCPLTVGGSFEAKTKNLSGDLAPASGQPGTVGGTLRVDLQTLETGIRMRDHHLKSTYLEVDKGPDFSLATIDDIRVEKLDGKSVFTGTLTLHGQRKPITGTADLQQKDGLIRVQARFSLKVSDFEIPAPMYLGVGVRDEIQIRVNLTAVPAGALVATVR